METKKYRLKEVLKIGNGKDHSSLGEGIIPVYGSGGFMRNVDSFLYDGESVLLPRKGSLSNIQYVTGKFWTVDTCYYTKIDNTIVDPYFLFILLKSLDLSGFDSGASIPSMTSKTYYGLKVDIPNIETQKKIASYIKKYDSLIELNTKRIKTLEQMAENLYKEWFVRFRFPGHENAEFENGIPKGWEVKRLEDFCYVTDGTHDTPSPTSDGFPLITGKHISDGDINFDEAYLISEEDHKKISKRSGLASGDILFSNIGTVGKCCIVNYDREFSVKNVIIFKLSKMYKSLFLYHALNSSSMQELFQAQTNGASQQFVGLTFMRRFKLLIPSESVLQCFYNTISDTYTLETSLKRLNKNLIKQRDLLLPRLMSGKLEV